MATILNMTDVFFENKITEVCKIISNTLDPFVKGGFLIDENGRNEFLAFVASELKEKISNEEFIELKLKDNFLYQFTHQINKLSDLKMSFIYATDDAFENKQFLKLFSNYKYSFHSKKDMFKIKEMFWENKFTGDPENQMEIPSITFII